MSLYPLSNTWDTKHVTVSNTWARKDTVTSYLTKYTLCTGMYQFWTSLAKKGTVGDGDNMYGHSF